MGKIWKNKNNSKLFQNNRNRETRDKGETRGGSEQLPFDARKTKTAPKFGMREIYNQSKRETTEGEKSTR